MKLAPIYRTEPTCYDNSEACPVCGIQLPLPDNREGKYNCGECGNPIGVVCRHSGWTFYLDRDRFSEPLRR